MREIRQTPRPREEVKIDFVPGESDTKRCICEAELLTAQVRKARLAVRSLDFVCSVLVIASLSRALYLFFRSNAGLWPPGVDVTAQLFFLVVAVLAFWFNAYIIYTYVVRNKGIRTTISRLEIGFQLAVTVIFLGVFTFGAGFLSLLRSGGVGGGKNIFKIACERAQTNGAPPAYWGICWTTQWAQVCTFIGATLSAVSFTFYILLGMRYYQRHQMAKLDRQLAEARAISLEHYNARGLQTPQLVSEMTKILPPTA